MITGVVLARNEEHHIADCLAARRPHVQEIILIDMESSDRTVELVCPLVDQVLIHPLVCDSMPRETLPHPPPDSSGCGSWTPMNGSRSARVNS